MIYYKEIENRKEGNDQESIQIPNTFRSKTPKEKKHALKVMAPQSKHYKQKAKRPFFSKNGQTAIQDKQFTKTCMQRHTMTDIVNHSRSTALERLSSNGRMRIANFCAIPLHRADIVVKFWPVGTVRYIT